MYAAGGVYAALAGRMVWMKCQENNLKKNYFKKCIIIIILDKSNSMAGSSTEKDSVIRKFSKMFIIQ
jgi:hypothetical protein